MARQREDEATALQPPLEAMVPRQGAEPGETVHPPQVAVAADAARISRVC